ncbi:hypothetical protein K7432_006907 [Basidiobolus ranarum]|uniref:PH domain-containing protein n=1 Tax=Basidiobolus ranarum TaxID=34480 RepID=A0ABR2WU56_9FUNG
MLKRLKTIHERMSPSPKKQRADSMISPRREFSIPSAQNPPQRAKSFYCARSRGPELEPAVSDWVYDRLKKKKINSLNKNSKSDSNNNNEDKDQKEKIVKGPRRRTRRSSVPSCLFKTIRKPIQPGECGVLYVRIHQLQYNSLKKSYDLRFALKVGGQECSTSIVKSQNQGDTSYTLTFDEIFLFDVVSDFTIQITAIAQASHNLVRKPSILSPKKLLRKIQGREKDPYPIGTLDLRFPLEKSEKRFVTHSLSLEKNNSLHHALLTLEIGVMIVGKPQKIPEFDGKLKEKTMKGSFQCVVYEDYLKIFTRTGVYSQTWSKYFVVFKDRKLLLYADKDKVSHQKPSVLIRDVYL